MSDGSASAPSTTTPAAAPAAAESTNTTNTQASSKSEVVLPTGETGKASKEAPTQELAGQELTAEQMDEALASAEESEDSTPQAKLYKVKIDGKEVEVSEDELLTGYQSRKASQKRFEEGAKMKKYADQVLELTKTNPFQALLSMGVDPEQARKMAEDYLIERMEEESLDPKEKELRAAKKKIEELEKKDIEKKQKEEQERSVKAKEAYGEEIDNQIVEALTGSGLPPTSYTVKRVAYYLNRALDHNLDLQPKDVIKYVKQDYEKDLSSFLGAYDGDKILSAVPKPVLDKIRKALVSKVKNKQPAQTSVKTESVQQATPSEDKKEKKQMTMAEWREFNEKLMRE